MKKFIILAFSMLMLGGVCSFALRPVILSVCYEDVLPSGPGQGKPAIVIPDVWIDDHTLTFEPIHESFTLYLVDSSNTPVHFDLVPINTQTVLLPSTLTGTYKLLLIADTHFFYGFINL